MSDGETEITAVQIAAAEALAGVSYTAAERQLMLDNITAQIELAQRRRALRLPNDLGPATRFDPRPPGFAMPEAGASGDESRWTLSPSPLPGDEDAIAFAKSHGVDLPSVD